MIEKYKKKHLKQNKDGDKRKIDRVPFFQLISRRRARRCFGLVTVFLFLPFTVFFLLLD